MDFEFNEQQQMFRETFRGFLEDHYALEAHVASVGDGRFNAERWRQLAELGLFGMLAPEQFGGLGLTFVDVALVVEELGRALISPAVCETLVATDLIVRHGSTTQKSRLLPRIVAGDLRVVTALTESQSGFGAEQLAMRVSTEHDRLQLAGSKILVPEAEAADLIVVAACRGPERQLGLVLIEPGRHGVSIRDHETLDPTCRLSQLTCSAVALSAEDWLGGAATDASVERLIDLTSTVAALQMMGIAGKVLDLAVGYATQRIQFGKAIGTFQAIKHKCADMAVAIEAGRAAGYFAAWAVSESPQDCLKAVSMAKSFAGDTVRMVCNEGTQIHGGMGFTWELGLHFYLRRAKLLEYSSGDAAFHRERVMAATLAELQLTE